MQDVDLPRVLGTTGVLKEDVRTLVLCRSFRHTLDSFTITAAWHRGQESYRVAKIHCSLPRMLFLIQ